MILRRKIPMKKLLALALALCLTLGAASAFAVEFKMGIDAEYPPFSYLDDNGDYAGFDVEMCKAACDILGLEQVIVPINWDTKLISLDNKEHDCVWSGMTILDTMKEAGYVLSFPYYDNTQVVLTKEGNGISTVEDLAGKRVAVQLGTSGEALLNGDLAELKGTFSELVTCQSFLMCFTELEGNAVDAVFVDLPVAAAYTADKPQLAVLNENLGAEQYGIAFRSGDADLCEKIENAVAELVTNGTYAQIAAKYPDIMNNLLFLGAE